MNLSDAVNLYLDRLKYVEMLSPVTIKNRRSNLLFMLNYFNERNVYSTDDLELKDIKHYFAYYTKSGLVQRKRNTISTMQHHIGMFFRYIYEYESVVLLFNPAHIKAIGGEAVRKQTIPTEVIYSVLEDAKDPQIKLMVLLLFTTGIRIAELVRIKAEDQEGRYLHVLGKGRYGGKRRIVYLSHEVAKELKVFVMMYGRQEGYIFTRYEEHSNQDNTQPINTDTARRWLRPYFQKYGYEFTPHHARYTFAQGLLVEGADVRVIQECLGHSSLTTTTKYLQVPQSHITDAYDKYMTIKLAA